MTPSLRSAFSTGRCWVALGLGWLLGTTAAYAQAWQTVTSVQAPLSDIKATVADANGNVYVAGSFAGTLTLGSLSLTSAGGTDAFVAKWNSTSGFVWAQRGGGPTNEAVTALALQGNQVYIGGTFSGPTAVFGTTTLANAGPMNSTDIFVASFTEANGDATLGWAQRAGSTENDELNALAATPAGVYAAGAFRGTVGFGATSPLISTGGTSSDLFVTKLTPAGSFAWAQGAGGAGNDVATALAADGAEVYVAGSFTTTATFGSASLLSAGGRDMFVARLTDAGSTGTFVWAHRAGGPGEDYATSIARSGGLVYVAGSFFNTATFGSVSLNSSGNADIFVTKLTGADTAAPTFGWALRAGGIDFDQVNGLAVSGANVYVAGQYNSFMCIFGNAGSLPNIQPPYFDIFLGQLTDAGASAAFTWARRAGGALHDFAYALSASGRQVYTAGVATSPAQFGMFSLGNIPGSQVTFLASLTDNITAATPADLLAGLNFYPNPARRHVTVQVPPLPRAVLPRLTIFDGLGRVARQQAVPRAASTTIPLTGLTAGLYHLQVQAGNQQATRTLVVE